MDLEKLVKTSLENFEPEVNPAVWQNIEQGLKNAPVSNNPNGTSAASSAGKSAIKSVFSHLNPWLWAAGIIATTAVVAVLRYPSPKKNNVIPNTAPTSTSIVIPSAQSAGDESPENREQAPDKNISAEKQMELSGTKNTKGDLSVEAPGSSEMTEAINDKNTPSNHTVANNPEEKISTGVTQKSDNSEVTEPTDKNEVSNPEVPPLIILNAEAGFAPLKVTALLNGPHKGNWDFGDGQGISAANSVTHSFNQPGSYKITCAIGDKNIAKTIEVIGTVSTAFTPNGDGINDEFYVESNQLQELNIKIVDRSGRQVFEITQPVQRWDGRDRAGKNLPDGTYFYNIFARSINGQPINQKGTISIFK